MSTHCNMSNHINGVNGHMATSAPSPVLDAPTTSKDSDAQAETDFLIVGCGPAGASLACFLGSHGELRQSFWLDS